MTPQKDVPAEQGLIPERPARVALVCALDLSIQALLFNQIKGFEQRGFDVQSVCSNGDRVEALRTQGLRITTIDISRTISPWKDLKSVIRLIRFFKREQIDIVHTHTPKAALLGLLASRLAGVPIRVNTIHGLYYIAFPSGLKRRLFKTIEMWACKLATFVFSQSNEDVELLRRERIVPEHRLAWLGNGIDLERFDPNRFAPDTRRAVREELDIPADAFVVGIVARMVAEKGLEELFQAISQLRETVPNLYLLHIGFIDTVRGEELTPDRADALGIGDICRFVGQRDDVPRIMTAMDVYALPSYREGYPRSVMEANAMGLPAVVTDIRGCREAVVEGENGVLIPARSVTPIVESIERLYNDPGLRAKLSQGALARARDVFDEQRVIRQVTDVYCQELERIGKSYSEPEA